MAILFFCVGLLLTALLSIELGRPKTKEQKDPNFYQSREWRELRVRVFAVWGRDCQKCGRNIEPMTVDHILPRSISAYKHLELAFENQQILCAPCNREKSNTDYTDYRDIEKVLRNTECLTSL